MKVLATLAVGSLLVVVAPVCSTAQTGNPKGLCVTFDLAIEGALKEVAFRRAAGIADNSAPRATVKELMISNQLLLLSMNLQLRAANGCAPLKEPLAPERYLKQAMICQTDLLNAQLGKEVAKKAGSELPLSCDTDAWKPDTPSGTPKQ